MQVSRPLVLAVVLVVTAAMSIESQSDPRSDGERLAPWRIRFLGPGDRPLSGVVVEDLRNRHRRVVTGSDGQAKLTWGHTEETLKVRVGGRVVTGRRQLTKRFTIVRCPDLIPLEVVVLDSETGRHLSGADVSLIPTLGSPLPLTEAGDRYRLDVAPILPGRRTRFAIRVEPPAGKAMQSISDKRILVPVSRYARRLVATLVARPEVVWRIRAKDVAGRPVAGAEILRVTLMQYSVVVTSGPSDASGCVEVRRLPALRGQSVSAWVRKGEYCGRAKATLTAAGGSIESDVVLDDPIPAKEEGQVGLGGGVGGGLMDDGRARKGEAAARLEGAVARRDGSPAAGALLCIQGDGWQRTVRASAEGRLSTSDLRPGKVRVTVREIGINPTTAEADLRSGQTAHVTLREPVGRRLRVQVVTRDGTPAGFAAICVTGPSDAPEHVNLEGSVQRVLLRADAAGELTLEGLPAGRLQIHAVLGGRHAEQTLTLEKDLVRLVL